LENTTLLRRIPLLFAPYYLQDGMNEHGVAVSDMSVDGVKPPHDADKPDVIHATAMRLILDYAKSTDEAIDMLNQYNIHFAEVTGHLLIADATGKSAVVEFIDGRIEATTTKENWQVCTNHRICGMGEVENDECCGRYQLASKQLASLSATANADDVMRIMESVAKEEWTMWTSVYDLSAREFRVAYRRHFDKPHHGDLSGR
jgi:predicted choloylglycine hydrolase